MNRNKLRLGKFQGDHFRVPWSGSETCIGTFLDIRRFLGSFSYPDSAGDDLPNLLVSIFKAGLLTPLIASPLWQSEKSCVLSVRTSLSHFADFLETEQRVVQVFGGLTTALGNIQEACV